MNKLFIIALCFINLTAFAGPIVTFHTSMGTFDVELNDQKAPISTQNFLDYVDSGFYSQTIFHRIVKDFVVQGGGMASDMIEKPTRAAIINEAKNGLSNVKYSLGMARDENINSATSQFYINSKDNLRLDYRDDSRFGYAVFAEVISGFDVIDAMDIVSTHTIGVYENVPQVPIIVISVTRK